MSNPNETKQLSIGETLTCRMLSHLKYNDQDEFYKCRYNDFLMFVSSILLGGRDPVKFAVEVLGGDHEDYERINKQLR